MVNVTSSVLIAAVPGEQRGVLPTHSWCHHRGSQVLDNTKAYSEAGIQLYWHLSAWAPGRLIAQRETGPGSPVRAVPQGRVAWCFGEPCGAARPCCPGPATLHMARGRCSHSAQLHRAESCLQGSKHRRFPCLAPMAGASCPGMCCRELRGALRPLPHSEGLPAGRGSSEPQLGRSQLPSSTCIPTGRWHHGAGQ